eukprot:GHVU01098553.1.p1 GENE.GHVU01098553.1~~GHVU01098553.1.p1  ORF type:complete len:352 (+),score=80.43 GHVU01098553.1:372-1427(+)
MAPSTPTLNIPSTVEDPNYRYKMPKLAAQKAGRGNGVKTIVLNMGDIAKSLMRPPEYTTKFFGCELGAQAKYEIAEAKAVVNGEHTEGALQLLIDKFIHTYVLCPNCKLPETDLEVNKGLVMGSCNACGHHAVLDNTHKVAKFIVTNPPGGDTTMGKAKGKKGGGDDAAGASGSGGKKGSKDDRKSSKDKKGDKKKKENKAENGDVGSDGDGQKRGGDLAEDPSELLQRVSGGGDSDDPISNLAALQSSDGAAMGGDGSEVVNPSTSGGDLQEVLLCTEGISFDSEETGEYTDQLSSILRSNPNVDDDELLQELRNVSLSQALKPSVRPCVASVGGLRRPVRQFLAQLSLA